LLLVATFLCSAERYQTNDELFYAVYGTFTAIGNFLQIYFSPPNYTLNYFCSTTNEEKRYYTLKE
jgi:hypothetical protein